MFDHKTAVARSLRSINCFSIGSVAMLSFSRVASFFGPSLQTLLFYPLRGGFPKEPGNIEAVKKEARGHGEGGGEQVEVGQLLWKSESRFYLLRIPRAQSRQKIFFP